MSGLKSSKNISKYKDAKNKSIKESNTLDNKHRFMSKYFNQQRNDSQTLLTQVDDINLELDTLDERRDSFTQDDIKHKASLLDKRDILNLQYKSISSNFDEMDYYDKAGDLITNYYEMRDNKHVQVKETKNILEFLCNKKDKLLNNVNEIKNNNRANLFEK